MSMFLFFFIIPLPRFPIGLIERSASEGMQTEIMESEVENGLDIGFPCLGRQGGISH